MGMAASQARLLSITARMHDVELKAQNIMNQKIALSTQKDELYQDYCAALDAKKLQIAVTGTDGKLNYIDATFTNVCGFNSKTNGTYALTDANTGMLIVDDDVYEAYKNFGGGDKYAFAFAVMGISEDDLSYGDSSFSCTYCGKFKDSKTDTWTGYVVMNNSEAAVYEKHMDDTSNKLAGLMSKINSAAEKGDEEEVTKAIDAFRTALYDKYSGEIYGQIISDVSSGDSEEFDADLVAEFKHYVQLFEGIQAAGGCIPVSKYAENGDTGNDWFNNVINTGRAILNEYKSSGTNKGWNEISPATSTNVQEVSDDTDLKKAEAKYEYELSIINKKDTRFDQDLNKLETERTALKTEMDSIKQVKDDNIERTFGIFS